jgi:hypothetical protein
MFPRLCPLGKNLLAILFVGLFPFPLYATDVHLKNGSVRRGELDGSTDETVLRLRFGDPDAHIVFGIRWDDIAEIRHGGKVWGPEQFDELRTRWTELVDDENEMPKSNQQPSAELKQPTSSRPLWESPRAPASDEPVDSRVRFIEVDAVAANWDASDDWDGIVLRVWPLNQSGSVVCVSGTLTAALTADKGYALGSDPNGEPIQPIGHWIQAVRVSNYGTDGLVVRLPFQAVHPDLPTAAGTDRWHVSRAHPDWSIANNSGNVYVRFSVPGHGTFSATTPLPVRLRRFSPLRDRYFQRHGTRKFPGE